jgi:septal ring factor EnvC (AmiA/AmiB activator)
MAKGGKKHGNVLIFGAVLLAVIVGYFLMKREGFQAPILSTFQTDINNSSSSIGNLNNDLAIIAKYSTILKTDKNNLATVIATTQASLIQYEQTLAQLQNSLVRIPAPGASALTQIKTAILSAQQNIASLISILNTYMKMQLNLNDSINVFDTSLKQGSASLLADII